MCHFFAAMVICTTFFFLVTRAESMCSNCSTTIRPVACACCSWSSLSASPYPGATVSIADRPLKICILFYSPADEGGGNITCIRSRGSVKVIKHCTHPGIFLLLQSPFSLEVLSPHTCALPQPPPIHPRPRTHPPASPASSACAAWPAGKLK